MPDARTDRASGRNGRARPMRGARRSLLPVLLCWTAWVASALPVFGQAAPDTAATSMLPPRVDDWLPNDWWTPVRVVSGRLNDDAYDDLAVLVERRTDAPEDPAYPRGSRGLFVIFGQPDGSWRRGPLAAGILPCIDCVSSLGGRIGSAVFDLDITPGGFLEVGWVERGRFTKAVRLRIGWDAYHGALGLYSDDVRIMRPHGPRGHVRRDYRAGRIWVDGVPQEMPARFIPIEEVSAATY
jgi:hypothetical protein